MNTTAKNVVGGINSSNARNADGADVLGAIVWWGLDSIHVNALDATEDWKNAGLPEEDAPVAPTPTAAYARAIKRATVKMADVYNVRVDHITETESSILHTVVEKVPVKNEAGETVSLEYVHRTRIAFLKETEQVVVEDLGDPVAANISEIFDFTAGHIGADQARPAITSTIHRLGGIPLRRSGGVYFLPAESIEELGRLTDAVEGWGESAMFNVPQYDTPQTRGAVAVAARNNFRVELASVRAELVEWRERQADEDGPQLRETTVARRLEKMQDIRRRAELYLELIDLKKSDILAGADDIEKGIKEVLASLG